MTAPDETFDGQDWRDRIVKSGGPAAADGGKPDRGATGLKSPVEGHGLVPSQTIRAPRTRAHDEHGKRLALMRSVIYSAFEDFKSPARDDAWVDLQNWDFLTVCGWADLDPGAVHKEYHRLASLQPTVDIEDKDFGRKVLFVEQVANRNVAPSRAATNAGYTRPMGKKLMENDGTVLGLLHVNKLRREGRYNEVDENIRAAVDMATKGNTSFVNRHRLSAQEQDFIAALIAGHDPDSAAVSAGFKRSADVLLRRVHLSNALVEICNNTMFAVHMLHKKLGQKERNCARFDFMFPVVGHCTMTDDPAEVERMAEAMETIQ